MKEDKEQSKYSGMEVTLLIKIMKSCDNKNNFIKKRFHTILKSSKVLYYLKIKIST